MIHWANKLYALKKTRRKIPKIKRQIESGDFVPGIYLITLSSFQDGQLDIIPAGLLFQEILYDNCPPVVGIASSRDEAVELVANMVNDAYTSLGKADLKTFMERRCFT